MRNAKSVANRLKASGADSALTFARKRKPRLPEQLRSDFLSRRFSRQMEQASCRWVKHVILLHGLCNLRAAAETEINAVPTCLAFKDEVWPSTRNHALSAVPCICRHVIGREAGDLVEVIWTRNSKRLAAVRTQSEFRRALAPATADGCLIASLPREAGLRLMKCSRLWAREIDSSRSRTPVCDGKGPKDRITTLNGSLMAYIEKHRLIRQRDLPTTGIPLGCQALQTADSPAHQPRGAGNGSLRERSAVKKTRYID